MYLDFYHASLPGLNLPLGKLKNLIMEQANLGWYANIVKKAEFSYFGLMAMTILIGSCWGSIAAMMILSNNAPIWQLAACILISMANNVAAIGQAPTKWLLNVFIASIAVNTLLILLNVL